MKERAMQSIVQHLYIVKYDYTLRTCYKSTKPNEKQNRKNKYILFSTTEDIRHVTQSIRVYI